MQILCRLLLIGLVLIATIGNFSATQAAGPEAVDTALQKPPPQLRPIEAAYEKIRIDMPDKELVRAHEAF